MRPWIVRRDMGVTNRARSYAGATAKILCSTNQQFRRMAHVARIQTTSAQQPSIETGCQRKRLGSSFESLIRHHLFEGHEHSSRFFKTQDPLRGPLRLRILVAKNTETMQSLDRGVARSPALALARGMVHRPSANGPWPILFAMLQVASCIRHAASNERVAHGSSCAWLTTVGRLPAAVVPPRRLRTMPNIWDPILHPIDSPEPAVMLGRLTIFQMKVVRMSMLMLLIILSHYFGLSVVLEQP